MSGPRGAYESRALGSLAGHVYGLVRLGYSDEQIREAIEQALVDAREIVAEEQAEQRRAET